MIKKIVSLPDLPVSFPEDILQDEKSLPRRSDEVSTKGGKGSGNWGHQGLTGVWGGSSPANNAGITNTHEFKKWFGNSRVVDKDGNPKLVYHGTDADFQEFVRDRGLTGFHFGTAEQANFRVGGKIPPYYENANVIPAYLSIQNPIELSDHDWDTMNHLTNALSSKKINVPKEMVEISQKFSELKKPGLFDEREKHISYWEKYQDYRGRFRELFRETLASHGYDGAFYENDIEGTGISWIALYPEQIKSPFNIGEFDPKNPNIMKEISQKGGQGSGNWGHSGLEGVWGGSSPTKSSYINTAKKMPWQMTRDEFENTPIYPKPDEGYQLIFHYTSSNEALDNIQEKGLLVSLGRSEGAGMLWGSDEPIAEQKPLVAFQVPKEDIGDSLSGKPVIDWHGQYNIHRDIEPKDILGIYPYSFEFGQRTDTLRSWQFDPKRGRRDWWHDFVEYAVEEGFDVPDNVKRDYEKSLGTATKGGSGSGNWGHQGLEGVWGGSSPTKNIARFADSGDFEFSGKAERHMDYSFSKFEKEYQYPDWWEKGSEPIEHQISFIDVDGWVCLTYPHSYVVEYLRRDTDDGIKNMGDLLNKAGLIRLIPSIVEDGGIQVSRRGITEKQAKALGKIASNLGADARDIHYSITDFDGKEIGSGYGIQKLLDDLGKLRSQTTKGGEGSGNWGHQGLAGVWGGSSPTKSAGGIPNLPNSFWSQLSVREQKNVRDELRDEYGDAGKPKISDRLPINFSGERCIVTPDGKVIYSSMGRFSVTHTQIFAYLASSGFEKSLSPREAARGRADLRTGEFEDSYLEGCFFDRGYMSLTFHDIEAGDTLGFRGKLGRNISIKSHLEPNHKGVKALKGLLHLGLENGSNGKMEGVIVFMKDYKKLQLDNFYDIDLLRGIRSDEHSVVTPVLKERKDSSVFKSQVNEIITRHLKEFVSEKGGQGSGNWGHQGLVGVWGGSSPTKTARLGLGENGVWQGSWQETIPSGNEIFVAEEHIPWLDFYDENYQDFVFGKEKKPIMTETMPDYKPNAYVITPSEKMVYGVSGDSRLWWSTHTQIYAYLGLSKYQPLTDREMEFAKTIKNHTENEGFEKIFMDKGYISIRHRTTTGGKRLIVDVKSSQPFSRRLTRKLQKFYEKGLLPRNGDDRGHLESYTFNLLNMKTGEWAEVPFERLEDVSGFRRGAYGLEPVYKEMKEDATSVKGYIKAIVIDKLIEWQEKGGQGSGNWGHQGLDNVWGGSSPKQLGTTISESNKYWKGTEADRIRREFLEKSEEQDEFREQIRSRVNRLANEMFERVKNGESITKEMHKEWDDAMSMLSYTTHDDFLNLVETVDVKKTLDASLDIWEVNKIGGFSDQSDKEWLRTHFQKKFNDTLSDFLQIVPAGLVEPSTNLKIETALKIGFGKNMYSPDAKKITFDPSDSAYSNTAIVHEFAHWLESHSIKNKSQDIFSTNWSRLNKLKLKAKNFLDRRTSGESPKYIDLYDSYCAPDKFHSVYVGKEYSRPEFTEVISMGMEYLYSDPAGFARVDPDYFNFVIDALIDI